jgi:hypothetical protein
MSRAKFALRMGERCAAAMPMIPPPMATSEPTPDTGNSRARVSQLWATKSAINKPKCCGHAFRLWSCISSVVMQNEPTAPFWSDGTDDSIRTDLRTSHCINCLYINKSFGLKRPENGMAERVGFEPTLEFPLNTLSKRAPSTTRPSLQGVVFFLTLTHWGIGNGGCKPAWRDAQSLLFERLWSFVSIQRLVDCRFVLTASNRPGFKISGADALAANCDPNCGPRAGDWLNFAAYKREVAWPLDDSDFRRCALTRSRNAAIAGETHLSLCQSACAVMSSEGPAQCSALK